MITRIKSLYPKAQENKIYIGPWTTAGYFIEKHHSITCCLLFLLFWLLRTQYFSGDGDQLSRMIESGVWMVQSELLSHAIFQLVFQILNPYGWDALSVMNLVSCIAGAISVWILLKFNSLFIHVDPLWVIGLFLSSGLFLLAVGHTEYYTQFIVAMFYFGLVGVGYLRDRFSIFHVSLAFSIGAWLHLGLLFALPSLLILPWLKGTIRQDYKSLLYGLIPLGIAFFIKNFQYALQIEILGHDSSANFVPLFYAPETRFYTMFSWGHLLDIVYAWTIRSWIFWPFILWGVWNEGFKSLFRADRFFLLLYSGGFTFFVLTWHPDLRIIQDWDLFVVEAAPVLLLALTYLPNFVQISFHRWSLAIPVVTSIFIMVLFAYNDAKLYQRGYGSANIVLSETVPHQITFNGHLKNLKVPSIRQGIYNVKIIDAKYKTSYNFYMSIVPNVETVKHITVGKE